MVQSRRVRVTCTADCEFTVEGELPDIRADIDRHTAVSEDHTVEWELADSDFLVDATRYWKVVCKQCSHEEEFERIDAAEAHNEAHLETGHTSEVVTNTREFGYSDIEDVVGIISTRKAGAFATVPEIVNAVHDAEHPSPDVLKFLNRALSLGKVYRADSGYRPTEPTRTGNGEPDSFLKP